MSDSDPELPSHSGEEIFPAGAGPPAGTKGERERPTVARPMVFVALTYLAGTITGRYLFAPSWLLIGLALAVAALTGFLLYRGRGDPTPRRSSGAVAILALVLLGWAASNRAIRLDDSAEAMARTFEPFAYTRVEGTIAELPASGQGILTLVLTDAKLASPPAGDGNYPFPLKVLVKARLPAGDAAGEAEREFLQGSRVAAWGRLKSPSAASSPAEFDKARYLKGRGVGAALSASSTDDIEPLPGGSRWAIALFGGIQRARAAMLRNLEANLTPGDASIAGAILLGERASLDDDLYEKFRRSGIVHIVCVSGLHMGLVLAVVLFLARLARLPPRAWAMAGFLALVGYSAITGFLPPVVRAAVMGAFLLGAWVLGRTTTVWAALAASAFVTLAFDPRNLIRPDWQLSYLCIASLALFSPVIYEFLPGRDEISREAEDLNFVGRYFYLPFKKFVWRPFSAILAIEAGMMPLQVSIFRYVSVVAFILNPIVIPITLVILLGAAVVAIFGWIAPVGDGAGFLLGLVISFFVRVVNFLGGVSWAAVNVPPLPPWMIFLYYAVLLIGPHIAPGEGALGLSTLRQRRHMAMRLAVFVAAVVWLPAFAHAGPNGFLDLYVLNVGQGDSLVLRFPNGKIAVIDGGRHDYGDQGQVTIAPFLKWLGAKRIDFLVATHADADHIGGLAYLIENFDVGVFIRGPDESNSASYHEMLKAIEDRGVRVEMVGAGEKIEGLGAVEAKVLNPWPGEDNNDASVVLLIDYGDVQMLLTGDIEAPAENAMIEHGVARDIEVLKVAHHGSKTSSTEAFLDAFTPEIALISVGRNNVYGHPSKSVIERFEERGMTIARTDQLGTLRLETDGHRLRLDHFGE